MNDTRATTPLAPGVERLLASLTGVFSAHVVAGPEGTLQEIHVLATSELHPKQIVRNVESALSAGLGIEIDRRIVSVAQLRADSAPEDITPGDAGGAHTPIAPPAAGSREDAPPSLRAPARDYPRIIFLGYDAHINAARRATCRVTLRSGPDEFSGQGLGQDTVQGRAEAAAQATFAALAACRGENRVGLAGVAIVPAHGKDFVLVAARALDGRRPIPLTGVAPLQQSPEEAAIFASLQATNRWRASL
ncbi:MAG TPA: hypothetical protein VF158_06005 [Longimicrobiales bacterium]